MPIVQALISKNGKYGISKFTKKYNQSSCIALSFRSQNRI